MLNYTIHVEQETSNPRHNIGLVSPASRAASDRRRELPSGAHDRCPITSLYALDGKPDSLGVLLFASHRSAVRQPATRHPGEGTDGPEHGMGSQQRFHKTLLTQFTEW
nr:hypothetical protein [Streptomyces sp. 846.5]